VQRALLDVCDHPSSIPPRGMLIRRRR
jgi:hypothetical protein